MCDDCVHAGRITHPFFETVSCPNAYPKALSPIAGTLAWYVSSFSRTAVYPGDTEACSRARRQVKTHREVFSDHLPGRQYAPPLGTISVSHYKRPLFQLRTHRTSFAPWAGFTPKKSATVVQQRAILPISTRSACPLS